MTLTLLLRREGADVLLGGRGCALALPLMQKSNHQNRIAMALCPLKKHVPRSNRQAFSQGIGRPTKSAKQKNK